MRWLSSFLFIAGSISFTFVSVGAQTRVPKYLADVQMFEAKQEHEKALAALDNEIRRNPDNLVALWWRTRLLVDLDKADKILNDCNKLIKADPNARRFPHIYTYRAVVYHNLDETANAMKDLDRSKDLNQITDHYYICRFSCLQTLGQFDAAITQLEPLINPKSPALDHWLSKRAYLYEATNRPDKALADLTRAIEFKPKEKSHWADRARLLEHLKRFDEAISDYGQLLKLDPTDETYFFKRGKLYLAKGSYKLALADLNKSISLDPVPSATAYECRAQIYDKLGNSQMAKKDRLAAVNVR